MIYYVVGVLQPDTPTDKYYTGPRVRADEVEDLSAQFQGKPVLYEHVNFIPIGTVYKLILGDKNDIIAYLALDDTISDTKKIIAKLKTAELQDISLRLKYSRTQDFTSFKNIAGIEISVVKKGDIPGSHIIWHGTPKAMQWNPWAGYRRDNRLMELPKEAAHNIITVAVATSRKMTDSSPVGTAGLDAVKTIEELKRQKDELESKLEEQARASRAAIEFKKEYDNTVFNNITNDCLKLLPQIEGFSDEAAKKAFTASAKTLFDECRKHDENGFPPVLFAFASASQLVNTKDEIIVSKTKELDEIKRQLEESKQAMASQSLKFSEIETKHKEAIAKAGVVPRGDGKSRMVETTAQASANEPVLPDSRKRVGSNAFAAYLDKYLPQEVNAKRYQTFTKANADGNGEEEAEESNPETFRKMNDRLRQQYTSRFGEVKIHSSSFIPTGEE